MQPDHGFQIRVVYYRYGTPEVAETSGNVYMIHPDDKECVFLQKRDGKHHCRIYHYRPRTCRGFKCNLADSSFLDIFGRNATMLLGLDAFGLPIKSL